MRFRITRSTLAGLLAMSVGTYVSQAAIIPALGPSTANTRTDAYAAAGWGFWVPVAGTTINRLGYWDQGENGLLASHTVKVGRFNSATGKYDVVAQATVPAGSAARLQGGYRWVDIPDLFLDNNGQGQDYYYIVASHGTDPWSDGFGNGGGMTLKLGTRKSGFSLDTNNNPAPNGTTGWSGPNLGYEPPSTLAAVADTRVKIMPLGDSITAGYTDPSTWNYPFEYGYRGPLATALLNSGVPFHFVGSSPDPYYTTNSSGSATNTIWPDGDITHGGTVFPVNEIRDPAIDQGAHRGYSGWSIAQVDPNIATWMANDDPDIVLVHLGTNGIADAGMTPANLGAQLSALIGKIYIAKPGVKVVVAQIIPFTTYKANIIAYNDYIKNTIVPLYQGQGRSITTVDQYSGFLTNPADNTSIDATKFSNGINHPNAAGYQIMANAWLPSITTVSLSGSTISSTTTSGSAIATLGRPGAVSGESVAYSLVSGAGSTDNADFTISGAQLKAGAHNFAADPPGFVYSIRVQATGSASGTTSQIFQLTRGADAADPAPAAITTAYSTTDTTYSADVGAADLLTGLGGVHRNYVGFGAAGQQLNDGVHGPGGGSANNSLAWTEHGNVSSSTFDIGTGNGRGYDVSRITSIAAWSDSGFMNQHYKVSVRHAGGTAFVPVPDCTVDFQPATNFGAPAPGATKVIVTRPGGQLFKRIVSIRFTFLRINCAAGTGGATYREIDVEGTPSPLTPFEAYMQANYPAITGADALPAADPDGDGLNNLEEYAFGTDPGSSTSGPVKWSGTTLTGHGQPVLATADNVGFQAVFGRRKDYISAGLTYTVQFSADLSSWTDSAAAPANMASDATMDAVSVPYPVLIPTADGDRKPKFFRVRISG